VQERIRRIPGVIDVTTDREQGGLQKRPEFSFV
jgi:hypothetical protein